MRCSAVLAGIAALLLHAACARPTHKWGPKNFKSLVTFGDSYTDDSRVNYFSSHDGQAPPVGWVQPTNNQSASGGYTWGHFVESSTHINRYNYAVSGAVCSNEITPRWFSSINANFPSVLEYEVPAFLADSKYSLPSGKPFLDIPAQETVYSMWIGTNDLGNYAFLDDAQVAGKTIPNYIECVYQALDGVYARGGRYFVLMNLAPLQLTPQYATPENEGVTADSFWPDKPKNRTEISYRMWETVATVNDVFRFRTPYEVLIGERYPKAHFAVMDMYGLLSDIYYHPSEYFAQGVSANVTGFQKHCDLQGQNCQYLPDADSFMWYDALHPSEMTDRFIAEEFVKVVKGESEWAAYW